MHRSLVRRTRRTAGAALALVALLTLTAAPAPPTVAQPAGASTALGEPRPVIFVGNNWDGTVQVINPDGYRRIGQINVIPDLDERMAEIYTDPVRLAYFLGIRELVGEGNDQYVDDMYSSNDGRLLIASRPSFADVVALNIATGKIVWRFRVAGQRSDHMAISPDGTQVAVSASTAKLVQILDVETGKEIGSFPSGDTPHENNYSRDGSKIFHASIGLNYTPLDEPVFDTTKGERVFEVVDAKTDKVLKKIDLRPRLDAAGYSQLSSAIRPMAIAPDERFFYFQLSFFHGFVEYDLKTDKVTRVAQLPNLVPDTPREQYLLDSAHHGLAMNGRGTKLCVAGTMDNYAAIVSRKTFTYKLFKNVGEKPYWATTSKDGRYCYMSWSGTDEISVFSYAKEIEIARVPVGNHPQRIREGFVPSSWGSSA